ncbi:MAG: homocysteine S-methyltransferase family protein [Alphaproteobacteria bacterium]|nr:homocysteine S-methyltransferase family protein [Alphaproteobacteria bacterium]
MPRYRNGLPQLSDELFLTDGGIETTLIFLEGHDLPHLAAYDLLTREEGVEALRNYFQRYVSIARAHDVGFVLESATWRANPDWAERIGHSTEQLAELNRRSIDMLVDIRDEFEHANTRMVISGCVGPRGDGYNPSDKMTEAEAEAYHSEQIRTFGDTEADMVTAITMNYTEEAIGITRAAQAVDVPVVISYTLETDGRLPTGESLQHGIQAVDEATGHGPAYFMINCAHPTHFDEVLPTGEPWVERIRGLRGNASTKSHAELDEATELDDGDPIELGGQYNDLKQRLRHLTVLGGCCGTDHRHVEAICKAVI